MEWNAVFGAVNFLALISWVALILLPRWPALLSALLYMGVGLLCLVYACGLIGLVAGWLPPGEVVGDAEVAAGFSSIAEVRALFFSDAGVTVGWTHYLAFDLFVGIWIARDGDMKDISRFIQAPVLLATFLAGPLGLGLWLLIREPAARKLGRFH